MEQQGMGWASYRQLLAGTLCGREKPQQENMAQTPGSPFWGMKWDQPPLQMLPFWQYGSSGTLGEFEEGDEEPQEELMNPLLS